VSELSSHREIIAYIGARVQNLQFMTLDVLTNCHTVLKTLWIKYGQSMSSD